jgi:hypothetical protein
MTPAKLKRHLIKNHSHMTSNSAGYFKRLLAQEARYLVTEFNVQKRKSRTVGEKLMMPACKIIQGKMLGLCSTRN